MSMPPLQFASYKGMSGSHGALQINLQKPHFYIEKNPKLKNYEGKFIPKEWLVANPNLTKDDLLSREGALFIEMCSATGKNVYDWEHKIIMAMSITDMGKLLMILEGSVPEMKIMHDPGAQTETAGKIQKWLNISSPKGIKEGVLFNMSKKEADGTVTKHMVPLDGGEVKVLSCAIRQVIPVALAWVS